MDKEILSTAWGLIKQGHGDFTVELLINQVPCSRGSFYHHYGSVDELLLTILDQAGEEMLGVVEPWLCSTDAHYPRIADMLRNTQDTYLELGPIFTLVSNKFPEVFAAGQIHLDSLIGKRIAVCAPWVHDPLGVGCVLNRIDTAMWALLMNEPLNHNPDEVFDLLYHAWCSLLKIEPGSEKHVDKITDQHDCWETLITTHVKLFTG